MFEFPEIPRLSNVSKTPPLEWEGVVGIAVNGVAIVHHHVDKASGRRGDLTMTFDNCGGHGGADHKYHYHIPPLCLLKSLNGTVPERSDWWLAAHPEAQWPVQAYSLGVQSPLIGWALDGFPIFGPYDPETGVLQLSKGACTQSELDECNGKTLASGLYAYFMTPTYPFVPKCLKGAELGNISDPMIPAAQQLQCTKRGFNPMATRAVRRCHAVPQFIFVTVQPTLRWNVSTTVCRPLPTKRVFWQEFRFT
jgi:hypothetical protein